MVRRKIKGGELNGRTISYNIKTIISYPGNHVYMDELQNL